MSLPPVPPRPYSQATFSAPPAPPPVPPLPPQFDYEAEYSRPHLTTPIPAPRPQRIDPEIPANMARNLDDQLYLQQQRPPTNVNYTPGFAVPNPQMQRGGPSPRPPQPADQWSPWNPQNGAPPYSVQDPALSGTPLPYPGPASPYPGNSVNDTARRMATLTFSSPTPQPHRTATAPTGPQQNGSKPQQPSLTVGTPTIPALLSAMPTVQQPNHDPNLRIAWCRDVMFLVTHSQPPPPESGPSPAIIKDQKLLRLAQVAVPIILQLAATPQSAAPLPPFVAEALYLRACLQASGAFPEHIKYYPRFAFRDFETAARSGFTRAWFKLGRDYESFGDTAHGKDCFERGARANNESCLYRLGIAHLLGQLGFEPSVEVGLPLIHKAASQSTLESPEPAYVYALLLLSEFPALETPLNPNVFSTLSLLSASTSHTMDLESRISFEARKYLELSASLHFTPAQYKLGHCFEFAQPSPAFTFEPLLSVEWYSKASQGAFGQEGEVEADMALSKWFLCGAEGAFEKDENLAWVFAERAAKRGLPSAMFAVGYYLEVGIGQNGRVDIQQSIEWYTRALDAGNEDARERLNALTAANPQALSRAEHEGLKETTLVRRRTQAKERSDVVGGGAAAVAARRGTQDSIHVIESIKNNTLGSVLEEPMPPLPLRQSPQQQQVPLPQQKQPSPTFAQQHIQSQQQQQPNPGRGRYQSVASPPVAPLVPHGHKRENSASGAQAPPGASHPQRPSYPAAHRYTLADAPVPRLPAGEPGFGAGPGGPPGPGGRAGGDAKLNVPSSQSAPNSRPASAGVPSGPGPGPRPSANKPTTFAEMGINAGRATQKEDCVIM